MLISEPGKKILPISRDLIGETQIGNPGFNGGSNEGKIDQCLSGGRPEVTIAGREPDNGPRLACASGWLAKSLQVLDRSVAEKAAGV